MKKTLAATAIASLAVTGCTAASGSDKAETIVVGYQSKTINTVTAGTLLKAQGYFEKRLGELGKKDGTTYKVEWQDYDTGAPITAQMLAGKIDIGSMGDYPLLINGATAGKSPKTETELVSITGYNLNGALNGVIVSKDSKVKELAELKGRKISASVGSAGHGTLIRALTDRGIDPVKDVKVENQQPSIGAAALQTNAVQALSQFVAWPGYLVFRDHDRLVYDGGALDLPTFHGVVVRKSFAKDDRAVLAAFLQAQVDATDYLNEHPLEAAETVAEKAGLPPEVVYLYNGRNGVATFETAIRPELVDALKQDVPFLESIGVLADKLDLDRFVNDEYVAGLTNKPAAAIEGGTGEVWVKGEDETRPVADAAALLKAVKEVGADQLRAAYIPDTLTGTRWFADQSVWLTKDGAYYPFATQDNADEWLAKNPGASPIGYAEAVAAS